MRKFVFRYYTEGTSANNYESHIASEEIEADDFNIYRNGELSFSIDLPKGPNDSGYHPKYAHIRALKNWIDVKEVVNTVTTQEEVDEA